MQFAPKNKTFVLVVAVSTLLTGCVGMGSQSKVIKGFHQVNEGLYRGARPNGEEAWMQLKLKNIKTVISLEEDLNHVETVGTDAERYGFDFYSLPTSTIEKPEDTQVLKFLEITMNPNAQPVYVHCHDGKDRTGTMIAIYRTIVEKWGPKEAYKEAKKFGFWPYRGDAKVKQFIHQLKDKDVYYHKAELLGGKQ